MQDARLQEWFKNSRPTAGKQGYFTTQPAFSKHRQRKSSPHPPAPSLNFGFLGEGAEKKIEKPPNQQEGKKENIFHCGGEAAALKNIFYFIPLAKRPNLREGMAAQPPGGASPHPLAPSPPERSSGEGPGVR